MFTRIVICLSLLCLSQASRADSEPLAIGYGELGYQLPKVGSYQLPPLGQATDGQVLNSEGNSVNLFDAFDGKYVLLSFVYTTCSDINGCPLTSLVFYQLKDAMQNDAELARNLKLLSLSFDPDTDTPDVMKLYAENFKYAGKQGDWSFLTTESESKLNPILANYNQTVQTQYDNEGKASAKFSHIIRVYLIDPDRKIRNVYNVDFLHKDIILTDVKTLMVQQTVKDQQLTKADERSSLLSGPGDDKTGYESKNYTTNSRNILDRVGQKADLLSIALSPPLGLPPVPVPQGNPLTAEKIALGRKLFFDRRLSLNDTFSCAMCHVPEQGFANNELATAVGIEGRTVKRNAPTVYNSAYATKLFHDGRESTLEQQVWAPLLAENEMANPSIGYVINKINSLPEYQGLFEWAFDGEAPTMLSIGEALAAYQRTLVSGDSPFDKWYYGKQEEAISAEAKAGFALFTGKAACNSCHVITAEHALFTDDQLVNTGLGYHRSMSTPGITKVMLAPGVFVEVKPEVLAAVGDPIPNDLGLYEVTQNPDDRWKFKTPSLRNVALTSPYMHDGSLSTLTDVVQFYNQGGFANELLDPRIKPLNLNDTEVSELVAFLNTLNGGNNDVLVSDAFAAPIGDVVK